jgi:preprotein translocase subunit SecG
LTAGLATAFMILALILAIMTSQGDSGTQGLVEQERQSRGSSSPAALSPSPSAPATQAIPQQQTPAPSSAQQPASQPDK